MNVIFQVPLASGPVGTVRTHERLFPRVYPGVAPQVLQLSETLATHHAVVSGLGSHRLTAGGGESIERRHAVVLSVGTLVAVVAFQRKVVVLIFSTVGAVAP